MLDLNKHLSRGVELNSKITRLLNRRMNLAREQFTQRMTRAFEENLADLAKPATLLESWTAPFAYAADTAQRSILFWDTLRQRGNCFLENERAGKPPALHFDYETIMDARKFERPVNYALLRIIPPKGVTVGTNRRPYVIIDPRAGHGPGIGGFKDDSQVGVALREGHPVYFVMFFPDPVPGQTLTDVTAAEQQFVRKVRQLHPNAPKPVIIGNCQGGWAAMMLASSDAEDAGPIVINGAPMSYWGGAFSEGEGDNPMRYSAGLLGGTWLSSFVSDLGHGIFDGAWLVQNFENLNPANTFWDKYYNLYSNIDTEPPRFLEFERWWGGFFLMNRKEIEWITQNLFVGNKLWSGQVRGQGGQTFDLRDIKSPIILFASMGDNITPPQQAFNWVADVYGSTEEIKARGQVIIGLLHQSVGHLGVFVSGKVAKKEHTQIVSVLKSIEALPPGLYSMQIIEKKNADGRPEYDVQFIERRLEEVMKRLNRFERADEKPFEAVLAASELNQRAYELFARPFIQAMSNDFIAKLGRAWHPLRFQRWAMSDLNPWLAWLPMAASAVKTARQPLESKAAARKSEQFLSELVSSTLDYHRAIRDALTEATFFETYGDAFGVYQPADLETETGNGKVLDVRDLPVVQHALGSIEEGGYPEAVARTFSLLATRGVPIPLNRIRLKHEVAGKLSTLLPKTSPEQQRRIRGTQDIIVRYEPKRALETLPKLLTNRSERQRLLTLLDQVTTPENLRQLHPTPQQISMLKSIHDILRVEKPATARPRRRTTLKHNRIHHLIK